MSISHAHRHLCALSSSPRHAIGTWPRAPLATHLSICMVDAGAPLCLSQAGTGLDCFCCVEPARQRVSRARATPWSGLSGRGLRMGERQRCAALTNDAQPRQPTMVLGQAVMGDQHRTSATPAATASEASTSHAHFGPVGSWAVRRGRQRLGGVAGLPIDPKQPPATNPSALGAESSCQGSRDWNQPPQ